jgi:cytoskeletal protein RodZ
MTEANKNLTAAQMLLEARTSGRRKREISTISKLLCIREEYLIALENGDYKLIPELVYILGFARNYAMELGLDPDEIVLKIKREMGLEDKCGSKFPEENNDEESTSAAAPYAKKSKGAKSGTLGKISKYVYKYWKWILSGLAVLIVLIAGLSFMLSLDSGQKSAFDLDKAPKTAVVEPAYNHAAREKFGTENAAGAKIILQAVRESWVKIEDARGNTTFSRVLIPGDIYYMPDGDKYKGTFGNAGGIDVWVDGKLAPKLGAANTRKTGVLMTSENLMTTSGSAAAE